MQIIVKKKEKVLFTDVGIGHLFFAYDNIWVRTGRDVANKITSTVIGRSMARNFVTDACDKDKYVTVVKIVKE